MTSDTKGMRMMRHPGRQSCRRRAGLATVGWVVTRLAALALVVLLPAAARGQTSYWQVTSDVLALFATGQGALQERERVAGMRCLTPSEAARENSAVGGVLGGTIGGVLGLTTGDPGKALSWGARGSDVGQVFQQRLPQPNPGAANGTRAYDYAICQQLMRGREMRKPINERLIADIGGACGIPRSAFPSERAETGGDANWRRLFACADRRPDLRQRTLQYLREIGAVNTATCAAARREIEALNERFLRETPPGGSFQAQPLPVCDIGDPEAAFLRVSRPR